MVPEFRSIFGIKFLSLFSPPNLPEKEQAWAFRCLLILLRNTEENLFLSLKKTWAQFFESCFHLMMKLDKKWIFSKTPKKPEFPLQPCTAPFSCLAGYSVVNWTVFDDGFRLFYAI